MFVFLAHTSCCTHLRCTSLAHMPHNSYDLCFTTHQIDYFSIHIALFVSTPASFEVSNSEYNQFGIHIFAMPFTHMHTCMHTCTSYEHIPHASYTLACTHNALSHVMHITRLIQRHHSSNTKLVDQCNVYDFIFYDQSCYHVHVELTKKVLHPGSAF